MDCEHFFTRYHMIEKALLVGIILLATAFRLYKLDAIPPGFYMDEAMMAYDAYSIMLTGRDHHGALLPIYTEGPGFWYAALPIYLTIPSIFIFGLTPFAARLPAAIAGILTIPITFGVVKLRFSSSTALWATFLLAIAPWHAHNSRWIGDLIFMPMFFIFGLYFFFMGLERKNFYFYLSAVAFGLDFYTYIPARVIVPLTGFALLVIYRKELFPHRKQVALSLGFFVLLLIPTVLFAIRDPNKLFVRYNQISLTTKGLPFLSTGALFLKNYLLHLSPYFLFIQGDLNPGHCPRGFGQLYLFEFPLVVAGIIACIREIRIKDAQFLIFWFLIYAIPSSLTLEHVPHALRSMMGIPLYQILSAVGIYAIVYELKKLRGWKRTASRTAVRAFVLLAIFNVCFFVHHYISIYPVYCARNRDYGWGEALEYAKSVENDYDSIVMTILAQSVPTMYPPFFLSYNPAAYQKSGLDESKYQFVYPEKMRDTYLERKGKTLYIVREEELRGIVPKRINYFPDGTVAFKIIEKTN